jgi:hypothetical protein
LLQQNNLFKEVRKMAEVLVPGVSTLEIKLGYSADASTWAAPQSVTLLGRINSIGGVSLPTEQIDASALEDTVSKYIAGRQDTGGEWAITVNTTDAQITEWETIKGSKKWFEVIIPGVTKAYWCRVEIPQVLPLGEIGQNELLTMEVSLTLVDVHGYDTKVLPAGA